MQIISGKPLHCPSASHWHHHQCPIDAWIGGPNCWLFLNIAHNSFVFLFQNAKVRMLKVHQMEQWPLVHYELLFFSIRLFKTWTNPLLMSTTTMGTEEEEVVRCSPKVTIYWKEAHSHTSRGKDCILLVHVLSSFGWPQISGCRCSWSLGCVCV